MFKNTLKTAFHALLSAVLLTGAATPALAQKAHNYSFVDLNGDGRIDGKDFNRMNLRQRHAALRELLSRTPRRQGVRPIETRSKVLAKHLTQFYGTRKNEHVLVQDAFKQMEARYR